MCCFCGVFFGCFEFFVWDGNLKLCQAVNEQLSGSSLDPDLSQAPLIFGRRVDIHTLLYENTFEFEVTDAGLYYMSCQQCSDNILKRVDLDFEERLDSASFDVRTRYQCDAGVSTDAVMLTRLAANLEHDRNARIVANLNTTIQINELRMLNHKLQQEVHQAKHDEFLAKHNEEGLAT